MFIVKKAYLLITILLLHTFGICDGMALILGPSQAGKTSIFKQIIKSDNSFHGIIDYTTRGMRAEETDGIEHNFVSTEKFAEMESDGKFFGTTIIGGNSYAVSNDSIKATIDLNPNSILIVNYAGYKKLKDKYKDKVISFYIDSTEEDIQARQENRDTHTTPQRKQDDAVDALHKGEYDCIIENSGNIEDVAQQIVNYINYIRKKLK